LAEGLLPPEIVAFYARGDWRSAVADWPAGKMSWEKEFREGSEQNAGRLTLDSLGGIVERESGKQPQRIIGFPFPKIDPAEPQAAIRILWNYFYGTYNLGNSRANVDLLWVSRKGVDRVASLQSHTLIYDGQKEKYLPERNPQNFLMQILATVSAPQDLYGTTVLSWRFRDSDKRDNNWTYVPALRRVREVSPANRSDGFLGSEMTQDDGPFFDGKPQDFTWTLAGETEMFRLADPLSLVGDTKRTPLSGGGWRGHYAPGPFLGLEDPAWKGAPWAPVAAVLARRKMWIVEGVPKDRYYLYGKLQLYVDQENFQGAWSRKFSWSGELLTDYMVLGYRNAEVTAPDGASEWFWGSAIVYNAAINLKKDFATVTGFPLKNRDRAEQAVRVRADPAFFDFQNLHRFGK
ncbi:MAG: outer membrane lipoprotein-sorting protein, partial [Candidatus Binatia bacterium]